VFRAEELYILLAPNIGFLKEGGHVNPKEFPSFDSQFSKVLFVDASVCGRSEISYQFSVPEELRNVYLKETYGGNKNDTLNHNLHQFYYR